MAVLCTSVHINGIRFLHCHQQRAWMMVTFQLKPTSMTGSSRQSFSTWENTRISLSWDASCSLSGSSNHEGPNFPIPITTLGIMADNSVIPFPGNGKRHTEPPGNRSYTWQQNRRKNSGPWNKAYVFLDSDPLNIGPTVKKADQENFHHFKLCWILGAEMKISEKKKKKKKEFGEQKWEQMSSPDTWGPSPSRAFMAMRPSACI